MIRPDDVLDQSLEHIMATDAEGMADYNLTKQLVTGALFSRYPERRTYSRRVLSDIWECNHTLELETLEDDLLIYAYLRFSPETKYVLAAKYPRNSPVFEEMPDQEELEEIRRFNNDAG